MGDGFDRPFDWQSSSARFKAARNDGARASGSKVKDPEIEDLKTRLAALEDLVNNIRIEGDGEAQCSGNVKEGFKVAVTDATPTPGSNNPSGSDDSVAEEDDV